MCRLNKGFIKTITVIALGTIFCSIIGANSSTKCYFTSSANAEANVNAAQFSDLIKYSFECAELKNIKLDSCGLMEENDEFNKWLNAHKGFNYIIENGCYIDYEKSETDKYPNDNQEVPEEGIIVNPVSINIYAGTTLKALKPIVYFEVEGEIKDYISSLNPAYCNNTTASQSHYDNLRSIGSTNINLDFTKFINGYRDSIEGTITIGYLNSYKYERIPVKFTKGYILYSFGRELFRNTNCTKNKVKASSDFAEGILASYDNLNDNQRNMLDMISPELRGDIERLTARYDDLLCEKIKLENEVKSLKEQNIILSNENNKNEKKIDELNQAIAPKPSEDSGLID